MGVISVLYLLANVAYVSLKFRRPPFYSQLTKRQFAAVPKGEFKTAKVTVAASLFKNIFGDKAGAQALPVLVALSALGHLLGVAFTVRK